MTRYRFPGYFPFLNEAAARIGRPDAEGPARRIEALAALANLCAQAGAAEPDDVPAIVVKATEFRDQIHAALVAADLMLAETGSRLGLAETSGSAEDATSERRATSVVKKKAEDAGRSVDGGTRLK